MARRRALANPASRTQRVIGTVVAAALRWDLRRAFDRVVWVGRPPHLPPTPLVAYANHQQWFDGHLLWRAARTLGRAYTVWMEELDRYPMLATQGALPFPINDGERRARSMLTTRRRLRRDGALLAYFPEGRLHPETEPLLPWRTRDLERLARIVPRAHWLPIGISLASAGRRRPVALLRAGDLHPHPDGRERDRLRQLIQEARTEPPSAWHDL